MRSIPRLRLFSKLLVGFWVTFFVGLHGLWLLTQLVARDRNPFGAWYAEQAAPSQIASIAAVLEASGEDAARELLSRWPESDREHYRIESRGLYESHSPNSDPAFVQETAAASAPDGSEYVIVNTRPLPDYKRGKPGLFNIPLSVVIVGAGGGLVFAAFMAWYLTRPVRRLRHGFERLASGELSVRLGPGMGRRRDEIADLARDFDAMADRLQELVASKQRLLHEVSHELRSPLARIQVAIGLARLGPDRVPAALDRIESDTAYLDAMIGELLTLARAEHYLPQFREVINLSDLVDSIVTDSSFEATPSGVTVELSVPSDDTHRLTVQGHPELIRRAVSNVVRNAVQHSPKGRRVVVSMENDRAGGNVRIVVTDEGPGVPEDRLQSIFEPYVRATTSGAVTGFGLGLAISKRAIEAHGGTITASNNKAGGLGVTLTLPNKSPQQPPSSVTGSSARPSG